MNPTIALVAGEDSGDQLGAALMSSLERRYPGCRFVGIGGERMHAAGLERWWDSSELAHFGLFEVVKHVARIWSLRRELVRRMTELKPDVFIGIDAPDFNLGLERRLRSAGIRTVHYVSPTVWAWRAWRIPKIRRATDLVLCLFPFEPGFLDQHGINAAYVGHPLADQIDEAADPQDARSRLGVDSQGPVFALLPGSRMSEVDLLADSMLDAAIELRAAEPDARFIAALANRRVAAAFRGKLETRGGLDVTCIEGRVRDVISAADVVVCASGTVTLETMLLNRPMVVVYRLATATYHFARTTRLIKARHFALPNILAGRELVPELIQHDASPARIAREVLAWWRDSDRRRDLSDTFTGLHRTLRCNAAERAADAVRQLLET